MSVSEESEPVQELPADSDAGVECESATIGADLSASSDQTAHVQVQARPAPSTSQRRLVPPDGRPPKWWSRYRSALVIVEWTAILGFFLLFLYLLYTLIAPPSPPSTVGWKVDAESGRWRYVVVHHSATSGGSPESFDRFHRENNGWENGLGYHFVIGNGNGMDDGEVAVGHRWRDQMDGAHVRMPGNGKANSYSIGIALVGDFDKSVPTQAQLVALVRLLRFLRQEYGISGDHIVGHGDVAIKHTLCPGKFFPLSVVREIAVRGS